MPRGTNPPLEMFLNLMFPWDQEHNQLWKCVTWTFIKENEKRFANYAAQSFEGVMHLVETRGGRANTDVYVGLGTQRMASLDKKSTDGYQKAERKIPNIVSHNAIWLDIDVGKKDAYATTADAFAALDDFADKIGLPETSMEVLSGSGGLHAYWCFKDPVPIANWIPVAAALRDAALAYGLKFDPQVTVNPAGILRVPGTWNHKSFPPKPVSLMQDSSFNRYDYQQIVGALSQYIGTSLAGVRTHQPPGQSRNHNLIANVGVAAPVGLDDVIRVCPTLADIEARGGNGDAEPLWNLAVLLASFTEDPVDAAHRLSRGDSRYTRAETDKKLHEKITARTQNQAIGWPQCASFSPLHHACATCSLFAQGKSPLHHAKKPAPMQPAMLAGTDPLMPYGFYRDTNLHVCTTVTNEKTKESATVDVLNYPMFDAGIDPDTHDLVFKTRISGIDRWCSARIAGNQQPLAAGQVMAQQGVINSVQNHKIARDFLVAWLAHLQSIKRTVQPATYGWTKDGSSFVFDQTIYGPSGKDAVFRGSTHDTRYCVSGTLPPWQQAMKLIYGNASLETVVASAFASPLISLTGSSSVVLSVYNRESGIGKTTAMKLAQAVWGDPDAGMSALADTTNSVMKKIADLKNLPIYWDELRTRDHLEKVMELVFQVTQGKAKSRLSRDSTQQAAPAFATMFVVASNSGIADAVYSHTDGTEAGGLRVFEVKSDMRTSSPYALHEAQTLQKSLEQNYGAAGAVFSEFVAVNRTAIKAMLDSFSGMLNKKYNFTAKERFWATTISTLVVGAHVANQAGLTTFDVAAIEKYLDRQLTSLRADLVNQAHTTLSGPDAGHEVLSQMVNSVRAKHLLVTNTINYGAGRPVTIVAMNIHDLNRADEVWLQYAEDGKVRARIKPFDKWLRDNKYQPSQVKEMLAQEYIVTYGKWAIGTGVPGLNSLAAMRSHCIDLTPLNPPGSTPGSASPT